MSAVPESLPSSSAPSVRRYDVTVIGGCGHIGLPLGIALADRGLQVALYDTDAAKRELVAGGTMPFLEEGAAPALQRVIGSTLHVTGDLSEAAGAQHIIVTIGTPVDEYLNPELLPMLNLMEELAAHLRPAQHVMLRSTVFPGTSQRVYDFLAARVPDVQVSFCPERIVQGQALKELGQFPQLVAGFTPAAVEAAQALFHTLGVATIVVSVKEAELAKLFSNAWRYIQFAIANQFYMIATQEGADFDRVRYAMTQDYDRAKSFPGAGFTAGPCLLKDTMQLSALYQNHFQLGQAAMLVNEGLPNFLVDNLRRQGVELRGARVGILGMAFKADTDDTRDSLSYKLAKILRFHGAHVFCSDEFVTDPAFVSKQELVATCPVVIVGAPHSAYRDLRVPRETLLLDLWGVVKQHEPG